MSTSLQKEHSTGIAVTVPNLPVKEIIQKAVPILSRVKTGDISEGQVLRTLDGMIMHMLASLNLKGTMNDEQIEVCVKDIYDNFQHETLEDFAQVFKRARQGGFGIIYRVDQPTIFGWIYAYLETKAQVRESLPREKPFTLSDLPDDKLEEIKKAVADSPMLRPGIPMTDGEVKAEGQVRPRQVAAKYYPHTPLEVGELLDLKVQYGREHTDKYTGKVLEGHPTFDEWVKTQTK